MAVQINVQASQAALVQSIAQGVSAFNTRYAGQNQLNLQINARSFSQPLGRITSDLADFESALKASNARVLAFGASTAVLGGVVKTFKEIATTTIEVEKSLTDINRVLNLSTSGLQKFSSDLFSISKQTATSFQDASKAALEFSRQGLNTQETLKRTADALTLVRLTGMSSSKAVEDLTATVNGFSRAGLTTSQVVNKLAAVEQDFAVSASDLTEALSRTGQAAQEAGVGFDELNALVTSAQESTARGGAVIGNALKTIFTRIQRQDTLDQLENFNIAVRDIEGNILPAVQILQNFAKTYNSLADAQRAQLSEQVAGVYQVNILKAIVNDMNDVQGTFNKSLERGARASNEAEIANAKLNQTLSALTTQTGIGLQQLANNIGKVTFEPIFKSIVSPINDAVEYINDTLEGEGIGSVFANGLLKGIRNIITGPGLAVAFAVIAKVAKNTFEDATKALPAVLGLTTEAQKRANIEKSILTILQGQGQISQALVGQQGNSAAQAQLLLNLAKAQTAQYQQQLAIAQQLAGTLVTQGVSVGARGLQVGPKIKSGGHIPKSSAFTERMGAMAGGYKPGKVIKAPSSVGNAIMNSAEEVKYVAGFSQPFINPPANSKAGKKHRQNSIKQTGVDPYMNNGFIPNFAISTKTKEFLSSQGFTGFLKKLPFTTDKEREKIRNVADISWYNPETKVYSEDSIVGQGIRYVVKEIPGKTNEQLRRAALALALRGNKEQILKNIPKDKSSLFNFDLWDKNRKLYKSENDVETEVTSLSDPSKKVPLSKQVTGLVNLITGEIFEKRVARLAQIKKKEKSNDRFDFDPTNAQQYLGGEAKAGDYDVIGLIAKAIGSKNGKYDKNNISDEIPFSLPIELFIPEIPSLNTKNLSKGFIPNFAPPTSAIRVPWFKKFGNPAFDNIQPALGISKASDLDTFRQVNFRSSATGADKIGDSNIFAPLYEDFVFKALQLISKPNIKNDLIRGYVLQPGTTQKQAAIDAKLAAVGFEFKGYPKKNLTGTITGELTRKYESLSKTNPEEAAKLKELIIVFNELGHENQIPSEFGKTFSQLAGTSYSQMAKNSPDLVKALSAETNNLLNSYVKNPAFLAMSVAKGFIPNLAGITGMTNVARAVPFTSSDVFPKDTDLLGTVWQKRGSFGPVPVTNEGELNGLMNNLIASTLGSNVFLPNEENSTTGIEHAAKILSSGGRTKKGRNSGVVGQLLGNEMMDINLDNVYKATVTGKKNKLSYASLHKVLPKWWSKTPETKDAWQFLYNAAKNGTRLDNTTVKSKTSVLRDAYNNFLKKYDYVLTELQLDPYLRQVEGMGNVNYGVLREDLKGVADITRLSEREKTLSLEQTTGQYRQSQYYAKQKYDLLAKSILPIRPSELEFYKNDNALLQMLREYGLPYGVYKSNSKVLAGLGNWKFNTTDRKQHLLSKGFIPNFIDPRKIKEILSRIEDGTSGFSTEEERKFKNKFGSETPFTASKKQVLSSGMLMSRLIDKLGLNYIKGRSVDQLNKDAKNGYMSGALNFNVPENLTFTDAAGFIPNFAMGEKMRKDMDLRPVLYDLKNNVWGYSGENGKQYLYHKDIYNEKFNHNNPNLHINDYDFAELPYLVRGFAYPSGKIMWDWSNAQAESLKDPKVKAGILAKLDRAKVPPIESKSELTDFQKTRRILNASSSNANGFIPNFAPLSPAPSTPFDEYKRLRDRIAKLIKTSPKMVLDSVIGSDNLESQQFIDYIYQNMDAFSGFLGPNFSKFLSMLKEYGLKISDKLAALIAKLFKDPLKKKKFGGFVPNFAYKQSVMSLEGSMSGHRPIFDTKPFPHIRNSSQPTFASAIADHGGLSNALSDSMKGQKTAGLMGRGFVPNFAVLPNNKGFDIVKFSNTLAKSVDDFGKKLSFKIGTIKENILLALELMNRNFDPQKIERTSESTAKKIISSISNAGDTFNKSVKTASTIRPTAAQMAASFSNLPTNEESRFQKFNKGFEKLSNNVAFTLGVPMLAAQIESAIQGGRERNQMSYGERVASTGVSAALTGATTGAMIGSAILPGAGSAIGAGVGALVGLGGAAIAARTSLEDLAKSAENLVTRNKNDIDLAKNIAELEQQLASEKDPLNIQILKDKIRDASLSIKDNEFAKKLLQTSNSISDFDKIIKQFIIDNRKYEEIQKIPSLVQALSKAAKTPEDTYSFSSILQTIFPTETSIRNMFSSYKMAETFFKPITNIFLDIENKVRDEAPKLLGVVENIFKNFSALKESGQLPVEFQKLVDEGIFDQKYIDDLLVTISSISNDALDYYLLGLNRYLDNLKRQIKQSDIKTQGRTEDIGNVKDTFAKINKNIQDALSNYSIQLANIDFAANIEKLNLEKSNNILQTAASAIGKNLQDIAKVQLDNILTQIDEIRQNELSSIQTRQLIRTQGTQKQKFLAERQSRVSSFLEPIIVNNSKSRGEAEKALQQIGSNLNYDFNNLEKIGFKLTQDVKRNLLALIADEERKKNEFINEKQNELELHDLQMSNDKQLFELKTKLSNLDLQVEQRKYANLMKEKEIVNSFTFGNQLLQIQNQAEMQRMSIPMNTNPNFFVGKTRFEQEDYRFKLDQQRDLKELATNIITNINESRLDEFRQAILEDNTQATIDNSEAIRAFTEQMVGDRIGRTQEKRNSIESQIDKEKAKLLLQKKDESSPSPEPEPVIAATNINPVMQELNIRHKELQDNIDDLTFGLSQLPKNNSYKPIPLQQSPEAAIQPPPKVTPNQNAKNATPEIDQQKLSALQDKLDALDAKIAQDQMVLSGLQKQKQPLNILESNVKNKDFISGVSSVSESLKIAEEDFAALQAEKASIKNQIEQAKKAGTSTLELERQSIANSELLEKSKNKLIDAQKKYNNLLLKQTEYDNYISSRGKFLTGVKNATGKMREEIQMFNETLGGTITTSFRDGLVNAMNAAANETDNLEDALLGVASTFLRAIQNAMFTQIANQITVGLFPTAKQKGGVIHAQNGMYISGGRTGDKNPAMLEDGEYVLNRNAVRAMGGPRVLDTFNFGMAPRFATGGDPGSISAAVQLTEPFARLSEYGRQNSPEFQAYADRLREEEMIRQQKRAKRKALINQLIATAISSAVMFGISSAMKGFGPKGAGGASAPMGPGVDKPADLGYGIGSSSTTSLATGTGGQTGGLFTGKKFANGGYLPYGNRLNDTIPALLTGGEYVVNSRAVRKYGVGGLNRINSGVARFQDGGMVGGEDSSSSPSSTTNTSNSNVSINITVNANNNGKQDESQDSSGDGTEGNARELSNRIKAVVLEVISTEQRTGGLLDSTKKK